MISSGAPSFMKRGITDELLAQAPRDLPVLGVSNGHLAIAGAYGGLAVPVKELRHGSSVSIEHRGAGLFHDVKKSFQAGCYHSFTLDVNSLLEDFIVDALGIEGEVMSIRHKTRLLFGLQFHPESILTYSGKKILKNFLDTALNKN